MRKTLAAVLMAAMLWPTATAQATDIDLCFLEDDTGCAATVELDLVDDTAKRVFFSVDPQRFAAEPQSVSLFLECGCGESMRLSMVRDQGLWIKALPVGTPDLVKGTWSVTPQGTTAAGQTEALPAKTMEVTATDTTAPTIAVTGLADGKLAIGAGASVQLDVQDSLLRSVKYRTDWMPANLFELPAPHNIAVGTFRPGSQTLFVEAEDRVGQVTKTSFTVVADALAPDVQLELADAYYQGIANPLSLRVKEHSGYTVSVELAGGISQVEMVGNASLQDIAIGVVPLRTGSAILSIVVVDALGNEARLGNGVQVTLLEADAVLLDAAPVARAVAGEPLRLNVSYEQVQGLAGVQYRVLLGELDFGTIELPQNGNDTTVLSKRLPPGQYPGELALVPPVSVRETAWSDNNRTMLLEVFLARVLHGNDVYHIRAGSDGLPRVAVDASGTTYPLTIEDRGLSSVYAFTADGANLWWDPSSTNTTVPVGSQVEGPGKDKGIPAMPVMFGMAALVGLALRRR